MSNRYIKKEISEEVKKRHYFECAWCGEKLLERHHIKEFSKGGKHTADNLILLCPNCHTQVHQGKIKTEELIDRKSTHIKGDRISGSIQIEHNDMIRLGNATFINVPTLIQYKKQNIIYLENINGTLYLNTRFYNKENELIFWMSANRFWTNSEFLIISKRDELIISNQEDSNNILHLWKDNEFLNVEGKNYLNRSILDFSPNFVKINNNYICTFNVMNCSVGISIE